MEEGAFAEQWKRAWYGWLCLWVK